MSFVLIIERDRRRRSFLEGALTGAGYRVFGVDTSDKALEVIGACRVSLILAGNDVRHDSADLSLSLRQLPLPRPALVSLPATLAAEAEVVRLVYDALSQDFDRAVLVAAPAGQMGFMPAY